MRTEQVKKKKKKRLRFSSQTSSLRSLCKARECAEQKDLVSKIKKILQSSRILGYFTLQFHTEYSGTNFCFFSKGKKVRKERRLRPAHRGCLLAGRRFSFSVFSSRQRSCEEDVKTKEYSFL